MSPPNPGSSRAAGAPGSHAASDLAGYEVLLCVTGGVAAYKSATIVSRLVQRGAGVTVAMTASARRFVTPLTFRALSARPVYTSIWQTEDPADQQHLALTEAADLIVVAPATANMLAKFAAGIGDDLVSTLLLAAAGPVLIAPAMNTRMWENPAVQANVTRLRERGVCQVGPGSGWLACRTIGVGRMAEPDEIVEQAGRLLHERPAKSARH